MEIKKIVGAAVGMMFRLCIAIFVLYFLYEISIRAYAFGYRIFADVPYALSPGRDISVTVSESMDSKEMAQKFEEVGLVEDWKLFWVQIFFSEYKEDLKPGTYTLNNSMNSSELLQSMAADPEEGEDVEAGDGDIVDTAEDISDENIINNDDWYPETETGDGYDAEGEGTEEEPQE